MRIFHWTNRPSSPIITNMINIVNNMALCCTKARTGSSALASVPAAGS